MSQLKSKQILFLFLLSLLFSLHPDVSKAESENSTERLLVTYETTKAPSRTSEQPSKVDVIDVPVTEVEETIDHLTSKKGIKHVEKDQPVYLMGDAEPNDSLYPYQKPWFDQINLSQSWNLASTKKSTQTVAVIDSGIDLTHPDLLANIIDSVNLVTPSQSAQDVDGHGTRVAGLIGAETNNNLGVASPSRGTSIMPIKVIESGKGDLSNVVQGIRYAIDHDADVINLSLGSYNHSYALRTVIEEAVAENILVVGAAGNDNESSVVYPAAYPNVLAVAAVETGSKEKASFSNYGSLVDLAAPGTEIYSTSLNGTYEFDKGTSMAAPIATSSAVLINESAPYLTNKQMIKLMKETADPVSPSYSLGSGLLNIDSAVQGVTEYKRIYGDTAIETAVEIAKNNWDKLEEQTLNMEGDNIRGKFVILARSDEFPDSLAASPLASKLNSPILLTKKTGISAEVLAELKRLEADRVFIIGGENAIPEKVSDKLKSTGITPLRIAGANRYETATEIASLIESENIDEAFIVSGEKFPDALSISSFAARFGAPVLFTKQNTLPKETKGYLDKKVPNKAYVIGGKEVVSENTYSSIPSNELERIGGENRYDTNFKVLLRFGASKTSEKTYFATGLKFPDALTGGAAASRTGDAIVLLHPSRYTEPIEKSLLYLTNKGISDYRILGGPEAISPEKAWEIDQLLDQ
ncbi:cell wall-binding repeat-containing protein [Alkalihalobacillus macyae]|uniref:cell wall-binding repeat-containing protein n=1 Tax=Guptibacillus hwajinpoensis TaxID=208199 RepID=UPI00273AADF9|nr:cell wall-binding repeat-containing protein [Alkalihalobacillus macyae]MDP4552061.1 cell wall-binding repeat-containing protein [Alkalihalobacillus macyae]